MKLVSLKRKGYNTTTLPGPFKLMSRKAAAILKIFFEGKYKVYNMWQKCFFSPKNILEGNL